MILLLLLLLTLIINVNAFNVHNNNIYNSYSFNRLKKPLNDHISKQNFVNKITKSLSSSLSSSINDNNNINNDINNNKIIMNIPNILTISRVVMIPFFVIAFCTKKVTLSTVIFIATCITDLLDGIIARKLNQTSLFGAFLDPVADKLMVAAALIMLTIHFPIWWYGVPVVLTLCREIAVSAIREWMAEKGQRDIVKVSNIGKFKTATQMIAIAALLQACSSIPNTHILGKLRPMLFSIGFLLLYISTFLSTWSGIEYFYNARSSFTEFG